MHLMHPGSTEQAKLFAGNHEASPQWFILFLALYKQYVELEIQINKLLF